MKSHVLIGIIVLALIVGAATVVVDLYPAAPAATSTPPAVATSTGDQPVVPPPGDATPSSTQTVTSADTGKTIYLHPGDRFLLDLGDELNWSNITVDNTDIVGRVVNITVVKGAQGVYQAFDKGTTMLTATGSPICPDGKACPTYAIEFKIAIVVD